MGTFSALLAICAGNSPVPGDFPTQRPVTRSFDVYFDLRLNKRLCKQSWGWWFNTLLCPLWRHSNEKRIYTCICVCECAMGCTVSHQFNQVSCTRLSITLRSYQQTYDKFQHIPIWLIMCQHIVTLWGKMTTLIWIITDSGQVTWQHPTISWTNV